MVLGLWPQLGSDDPRQYDLDKAYGEAVTNISLNLQTGVWDAIAADGTQAVLRITCSPERHTGDEAPMLAEVWNTSYGLLFIARLPGAVFDPDDYPKDSFAPPTAVLSGVDLIKRAVGQPRRTSEDCWRPIPVTIVRLLLDGPVDAPLWVKCADHGAATVDRLKLNRVYQQDKIARRQRDTRKPRVIRLHDVGALSSKA